MILASLANEVQILFDTFIALQNFALKEDKLELKCHN